MDALIFIEPISSGARLKQTAHAMGYKVICVFCNSPEFYTKYIRISEEIRVEHCDQIIHSNSVQTILHEIKQTQYQIKGCIAATEGGVELAAQLSTAFKIPSIPIQIAESLRDKGIMRKVLRKSGLSCPDFAICGSEKELHQFCIDHSFPMVIKTPKGAGTSQVYVCDHQKDLQKHFQEIIHTKDVYDQKAKHAVVEEYIDGQNYIVDTFSDGHRTHITDVWRCDKISSKTFENISYNAILVPLDDPSIQRLKNYAIQVVDAFQLKLGPSHIELKDDPKRGPTLIEIGGRLAGSGIPVAVCEHSNFDIYRATIEIFTKGKTDVPDPITHSKLLALCYCSVFKTGTVKQILGIEEIQKLPSYLRHQCYIHVGDHLEETTFLFTIPCFVWLANADKTQLLRDVAQAHALFQVVCV